jgi:hypothetical protein
MPHEFLAAIYFYIKMEKFIVGDLIGNGTYGQVYKAID